MLRGEIFGRHAVLKKARALFFPGGRAGQRVQAVQKVRVCVPITAYPVTGGMRTILEKIEQVMADHWEIEYLTQHIGPLVGQRIIHRFGTRRMIPWHFPFVWLYFLAGLGKLLQLLWSGNRYDLLLPQDGLFTAAFTGLVGKLAGIRVVCIDHGNLVALYGPLYRAERLEELKSRPWLRRNLERLLLTGYWSSLRLLAHIAARCVDHFCVPGVAGDGIEEICEDLGIGPERLTRFVNMVDVDEHTPFDPATKAVLRKQKGLPATAIVIATICRLTAEKGVDLALASLERAFTLVPADLARRTRLVIAGDGPLRQQLAEDIRRRGLEERCLMWGELSHTEALLLHRLSDIHLYSGTRAGGYPLSTLEALASGCAVITSNVPFANECMVADGRGFAVPVGDVEAMAHALARLMRDRKLCQCMGERARDYVAQHNTASAFRRVWMGVTEG